MMMERECEGKYYMSGHFKEYLKQNLNGALNIVTRMENGLI